MYRLAFGHRLKGADGLDTGMMRDRDCSEFRRRRLADGAAIFGPFFAATAKNYGPGPAFTCVARNVIPRLGPPVCCVQYAGREGHRGQFELERTPATRSLDLRVFSTAAEADAFNRCREPVTQHDLVRGRSAMKSQLEQPVSRPCTGTQ